MRELLKIKDRLEEFLDAYEAIQVISATSDAEAVKVSAILSLINESLKAEIRGIQIEGTAKR